MEPLEILRSDEERRAIIGRKKSLFRKNGFKTALYIGKIEEEGPLYGYDLYMDALLPHVVFVAGARGSGKSYTLGVIAEELAEKNPYVGVLIIDPIGIFWSMKLPNRQEEEIEKLAEWGLTPKGYDNVEVYVPKGMADRIPPETYDKVFSLKPSMLTTDDWVLTFGLDRFSPAGLLLDKVLEIVREKRGDDYGLEDIIEVLENEEELLDKEKGFKKETVRALLSRFYAARNWGIFDREGTPLSEIIQKGKVSILDISFLEESVGALVIGIMARRILQARKLITRSVAAELLKLSEREKREVDIPPTWLIIDEAHTLIPAGSRKTAATDPLIEYVKQGRRPGCSLVFATQQPSAIDSRVLSQLDILIVHKLVFGEDVKAVEKRMPTILPKEYSGVRMRRLPVGVAIIGDREDSTSRAFLARIRPRRSQHEGREVAVDEKVSVEVPEEGEEVEEVKKERKEEKLRRSFVVNVTEDRARKIMASHGSSFLRRILGGGGNVVDLKLKFVPVWEVTFAYYNAPRGSSKRVAYIDGYEGEFIHYKDGKIVFSKGLKYLYKLSRNQRKLLLFLKTHPGSTLSEIVARAKVPAAVVEKELELLKQAGLVKEEDGRYYTPLEIELPLSPEHSLIPSMKELLVTETRIEDEEILPYNFKEDRVAEILRSIWPGVVPREVEPIYRPVWVGIVLRGGKKYKVIVDAISGVVEKEIPLVEA
ncbi:MAG: DUF87 domain-containing protein [Candidatus Diapherotrites archaeon]|nr:DUF87 domain-containing protein [Candidatus Diapherotrites archaeon]